MKTKILNNQKRLKSPTKNLCNSEFRKNCVNKYGYIY